MKTENVTIRDCKTSIYHSTKIALDSLHIDIKCTEIGMDDFVIVKEYPHMLLYIDMLQRKNAVTSPIFTYQYATS